MSIKKKLAALLLGEQSQKPPDEEIHEQARPAAEDHSDPFSMAMSNESLLELPAEHQIFRLYNQRRQEAGYLPSPRVCLDEEGVIPQDVIKKECNRFRTLLTGACNARLKEVREKTQKHDHKQASKKDEEQNSNQSGMKHQKKAAEPADGPPALDALPIFFLSADKLYAWLMVFPPVGKGEELSRDMLYQALAEQRISYGVDTRLMDRLSHDDRRYFNLFLVAKGKPAFDGKNGNIVDNFPRVVERVLEADEFDQVDYTELNLIRNVEQGQEICRLIKPTEGEPGRSVLDQEIPAKSGKSVPLPQGRNTEISEDGVQLLAAISGSVEYTGRSFQVKPVLEIPGDVDFSTGNLNFLGDINIHGNILSGFTVRAMGNIRVAGVVEAGSVVEAGGDLVVAKGILGDGTTTV